MASPIFDNLTFPAVRARINAIFKLLDTKNAGAVAPTDYEAYSWWLDTSGAVPLLKFRNASNTTWVTFSKFNGQAYRLQGIDYLTSGAGATYTPGADVSAMIVDGVGGGGGAGGADGQGPGTIALPTAGSGGGWFSLFIVNPAASYTYTIGAGGTGGAAGNNNGTAGGTTSFTDGTNTATAPGGGGGGGHLGSSGAGARLPSVGGVGSLGGFTGIVGKGLPDSGRGISGGVAIAYPNSGGSLFGGGVPPVIGATGTNATIYGEGGGAPVSEGVASNYAGGNGFQGVIRVTKYF